MKLCVECRVVYIEGYVCKPCYKKIQNEPLMEELLS